MLHPVIPNLQGGDVFISKDAFMKAPDNSGTTDKKSEKSTTRANSSPISECIHSDLTTSSQNLLVGTR